MRRTSLACLALLLAAAACGPSDGDDAACEGLLAGDLVITEVQANPAGADTGKEWIEIYNPGGARDLAGVTIAAAKPDGTGEKSHTLGALMAGSGEYVVLGGVLQEVKPSYVDYGYGNAFDLLNGGGRVILRCGSVEIDRADYGDAADGAAFGFTGAMSPDYQANDDGMNWCPATVEYEAGNFGSPGAANEICPIVNPPGMCDDGGGMRPTDPPVPGDLVITEILPDPNAAADATAEWFEVFVNRSVDLNGVGVGKTLGDPDSVLGSASTACVRVNAGDYLVIARSADSAMNGMLPKTDGTFATGLTNSGGTLILEYGGTLLDSLAWQSAKAGVSIQVDPDATDTSANDDPANLCDTPAGTTFGAGDRGTPGAMNTQCPLVVPMGMCNDGGNVRPIVAPAAGQIVITELMPDPAAVGDTVGEWFEVHATAAFDLNGLEIGRTAPTVQGTITSVDCIEVAAGSYTVLARNTDMMMNGGLPATSVRLPSGVSLTNSNSSLFVGVGGVVLDVVTWTTVTAGSARQLDPDILDATANDTLTNWCNATSVYGAGDKGTPGLVNDVQCP